MKIVRASYSALINLGDYNNEKIGLTAVVEDESPEECVEKLKEKVIGIAGKNAREVFNRRSELQEKLYELERKTRKASEEWNRAAEFLRAQGIKPDAVDMPQFTNLSPAIESEELRVIEGEVDFEDQEVEEDEEE